MPKFFGVIPALITPFDDKGMLYISGLENEIEYLYNNGFSNVFACGSYGSFPLMTTEQRRLMIGYLTKFCLKRKMNTIIQIGSPRTETAVQLAKYAEECGSTAISAVVPFYYSGTFYNTDTFLKYFEEIINSVSIDVHFYNNPKATGFNVTPKFLSALINLGLRGIKDGGSDMGKMMEMIKVIDNSGVDFDYYPSSTSSLIIASILGIKACVSGVALSIPELVNKVYYFANIKEYDKAIYYFKIVMETRKILGEKCGRAIAAYDILKKRGVDVGTCKDPWIRLNRSDLNWLFKQLSNIGVL